MTFKEILEYFGFERNIINYAYEYRILIGTKYYFAFLSPNNDECVKWQGRLFYKSELFKRTLNDWLVEIILEA